MCFNDSDSLNSIFHQVIRLHYQRTHMLLDEIGLYPGQPFLLFALSHTDGQRQKDLAHQLNIKASTITAMVRRMEKSGLIERKQDTNDQRVLRVYLTEEGKKICKEVSRIKSVIDQESFDDFTEEERILLRRLLMQMGNNLKKQLNINS